jgi:hypothetical protein
MPTSFLKSHIMLQSVFHIIDHWLKTLGFKERELKATIFHIQLTFTNTKDFKLNQIFTHDEWRLKSSILYGYTSVR